ncbi:MAG: adenylate/guanylate cyclase domain-containing protein [Symploca sp. SIO2C1]|nr:adenylate/guanylate cyclase domain-containing protein [Symploca sp. SIO2C1]
MNKLTSQALGYLLNLLFKQTILMLTILFCIGVGIAVVNMSRLSSNLIKSQAIQNSAFYSQAIREARTVYSSEVVNRIEPFHKITITSDYKAKKGAIPLPATYLIELGKRISAQNQGMLVRLYSDYPFQQRLEQGETGPQDDFELEALRQLRQNPKEPFFRLEEFRGSQALRYATADIMKPSCVACHNTHPDSTKTDWKVGDVRGVLEIIEPLDTLIAQTHVGLRGISIMLGGISLLGISGITLVIARLRQTANELELRVRERTVDLAQANTELGKSNALIRHVFGRYLTDTVVTKLLEDPERLKLGGERRKITILTSDLRGFTAISEQLPPEEVVQILNLYLKHMADVITKHEGTIDEFLGDGILVLFGAPTIKRDDALRAVACAVEMQLAMVSVNAQIQELGFPAVEMGIGINTGEVVVGNIGSEKRTKYGVVGSQVNLTYRIESYTLGGQIMISESTLKEAGSIVKISGHKEVKPKGVKQPITIYEVGGVSGEYNLFLRQREEDFLSLPKAIPVQYTVLEGKDIGERVFAGSLVKLSEKCAEINCKQVEKDLIPSQLSNIKLNLLTKYYGMLKSSEDIYAKVLEQNSNKVGFYICFTSTPPTVKNQLDALYQKLLMANG